jgi:hypothetical protein
MKPTINALILVTPFIIGDAFFAKKKNKLKMKRDCHYNNLFSFFRILMLDFHHS